MVVQRKVKQPQRKVHGIPKEGKIVQIKVKQPRTGKVAQRKIYIIR